MTETIGYEALIRRLATLTAGYERSFVAIAGAPGSGKSRLAERLLTDLEAEAADRTAILPMDGFHYDKQYLEPRGLLPREGALETFDIDGFQSTLSRLSDQPRRPVAVPVFDRAIETARAAAKAVTPDTRLVIVEGTYLLLDHPSWRDLHRHFALTLFLGVPLEALHARLIERWAKIPPEVAVRKLEENDVPNARLVNPTA